MLQCDLNQYARHITRETQKHLEGTGPYTCACLQLYQKQCNWFQSILPYVWMKPHLPIDLIFGTSTTDLKESSITYVENLKKRMEWAYQTTNDIIKKEKERNK